MKTILIIEDDKQIIHYLSEYLKRYSYDVKYVDDFENCLEIVSKLKPDLILLDINLPKFDGIYFLQKIRKKYSMPIIILSARNDEIEQIRGIELGANDYITKPFSMGILLAKINSILKNNIDNSQTNSSKLNLSTDNMKLRYEDTVVDLTKNEFKLFNVLINNFDKIVSREELLKELWDDSEFVDDNTLTVNITRARKILKSLGNYYIITTKRGIGYVLSENND